MRYILALMAAVALAGPSCAEWQVSTDTDPLTDKTRWSATLRASNSPATLRVSWVLGRRSASIVFESFMGMGKITAAFRLDNGPEVRRYAWVSSGREVQPWGDGAEVDKLAAAKRARVVVSPIGIPPLMVDFDLTGADVALRAVNCR